jgi:hypothetical protein
MDAADAFEGVAINARAVIATVTQSFFIDSCPPIRARMRKSAMTYASRPPYNPVSIDPYGKYL